MNKIKNRKVLMKSTVKTEKASTCFVRLYGRAAYEAWKAREAKLDAIFRTRRCSNREICRLREDSFRQMKAEGARLAASEKRTVRKPLRLAA